jgi:hypothetical protein
MMRIFALVIIVTCMAAVLASATLSPDNPEIADVIPWIRGNVYHHHMLI